MTLNYLKNKIKNTPQESGVYIFKGPQRKPLYIGKAANLKSRVSSYLKTEDVRIQKMVSFAKSLEHITTSSDIEALILESQLIKKFSPQFNIVMRDDKQYASVGFTAEEYPKIFITHQPTSKYQNTEMSSFIGPFTDVGALKITLRYLRHIFPYCICKKPHNNFCLNYHIGKCLGYCCLKKPELSIKYQVLSDYKKNVRAIKDILSGKKGSLVKKLEREMVQMAKNGNLEKAIETKDKISKLKRVFENVRIIHNTKYLIHDTESITKSQNISKELARLLKLNRVPNRIEGYDVSNIGGAHATGSMVTFVHGQPDKNCYRKFKIQGKNTPDDTAMLKEVLERRFKHYEWPFPDLILIDGGKAQLNTAHSVISNYYTTFFKKQRAPFLIALTKNKKHIGEKIYIYGKKTPLVLTKLSTADKNLLLAINSEAHRFAILYYRKLHRKLLRSG